MRKYTIKELGALIEAKLSHNFGTMPKQASDEIFYKACVMVVLDIMRGLHQGFMEEAEKKSSKMVYYLSMEFLMGRSLKNSLYNLGLEENLGKALAKYGV